MNASVRLALGLPSRDAGPNLRADLRARRAASSSPVAQEAAAKVVPKVGAPKADVEMVEQTSPVSTAGSSPPRPASQSRGSLASICQSLASAFGDSELADVTGVDKVASVAGLLSGVGRMQISDPLNDSLERASGSPVSSADSPDPSSRTSRSRLTDADAEAAVVAAEAGLAPRKESRIADAVAKAAAHAVVTLAPRGDARLAEPEAEAASVPEETVPPTETSPASSDKIERTRVDPATAAPTDQAPQSPASPAPQSMRPRDRKPTRTLPPPTRARSPAGHGLGSSASAVRARSPVGARAYGALDRQSASLASLRGALRGALDEDVNASGWRASARRSTQIGDLDADSASVAGFTSPRFTALGAGSRRLGRAAGSMPSSLEPDDDRGGRRPGSMASLRDAMDESAYGGRSARRSGSLASSRDEMDESAFGGRRSGSMASLRDALGDDAASAFGGRSARRTGSLASLRGGRGEGDGDERGRRDRRSGNGSLASLRGALAAAVDNSATSSDTNPAPKDPKTREPRKGRSSLRALRARRAKADVLAAADAMSDAGGEPVPRARSPPPRVMSDAGATARSACSPPRVMSDAGATPRSARVPSDAGRARQRAPQRVLSDPGDEPPCATRVLSDAALAWEPKESLWRRRRTSIRASKGADKADKADASASRTGWRKAAAARLASLKSSRGNRTTTGVRALPAAPSVSKSKSSDSASGSAAGASPPPKRPRRSPTVPAKRPSKPDVPSKPRRASLEEEKPFSGKYDNFFPLHGHFQCAGCRSSLYSASAKFDAGVGYPSFDMCYAGAVVVTRERSWRARYALSCDKCGMQLGHAFPGEGLSATDERHSVRSGVLAYDVGGCSEGEECVVN